MVKLALLGATGSIGTSTLAVLREQSAHFTLSLVSAHTDWQSLLRIAEEFKVKTLVLTGITYPRQQEELRRQLPRHRILYGGDGLLEALREGDYDVALNAVSGSAGLQASFAIAQRGKRLALANKESLVMAGHLLIPLIKETGAKLIPVDSEHSALFQCIGDRPESEIRKVHITASGGAFRDLPLDRFADITPQQALKHPNWNMGAKVTLDSATMFNKALEVMEAHWLFGLPYAKIGALLHPQSVVHSLVEFVDGSFLAQLSAPDMKLPILCALSHPRRLPSQLVQTDLTRLGDLTFGALDPRRYPLFYLGLEVAREGGLLPTALNAANEAALQLFLSGRIAFTDIHRLCAEALEDFANIPSPSLEEIISANRAVFEAVTSRHN
ncbi:MAG TPA: 1-deoxy-D-xylulose-5-phosphate reductoisomerase [Candidatus Syntrophosphaera sp.]|nr:1-deoxy-D-xylulose-5-phosphate reductoisomerase [Candidatus Syntrophosphaera sp.]